MLLFASALGCLSFALNWGQRLGFATAPVLGLFALAAANFVLLLFVETRVAGPDPRPADVHRSLILSGSAVKHTGVRSGWWDRVHHAFLPRAGTGLPDRQGRPADGSLAGPGWSHGAHRRYLCGSLRSTRGLTGRCLRVNLRVLPPVTLDKPRTLCGSRCASRRWELEWDLFSAANNTSVLNAVPASASARDPPCSLWRAPWGKVLGCHWWLALRCLRPGACRRCESRDSARSAAGVPGARRACVICRLQAGIALLAVAAGLWRLSATQTHPAGDQGHRKWSPRSRRCTRTSDQRLSFGLRAILLMSTSRTLPSLPHRRRWYQLLIGIICMAMVANLQYGWTLFVNPIERKIPLGEGIDPGCIHHLRSCRNLARADRGIPRGPIRSRTSNGLRSRTGGIVLGTQLIADSLRAALPRCRDRRSRGGRSVRHMRGNASAMVSRPTRVGCGADRHGVRCRFGADRGPDRIDDQEQRIRNDVPVLRRRAGSSRLRARLVSEATRSPGSRAGDSPA